MKSGDVGEGGESLGKEEKYKMGSRPMDEPGIDCWEDESQTGRLWS